MSAPKGHLSTCILSLGRAPLGQPLSHIHNEVGTWGKKRMQDAGCRVLHHSRSSRCHACLPLMCLSIMPARPACPNACPECLRVPSHSHLIISALMKAQVSSPPSRSSPIAHSLLLWTQWTFPADTCFNLFLPSSPPLPLNFLPHFFLPTAATHTTFTPPSPPARLPLSSICSPPLPHLSLPCRLPSPVRALITPHLPSASVPHLLQVSRASLLRPNCPTHLS